MDFQAKNQAKIFLLNRGPQRDIVASHSDYDLVTLQEVWLHEDYEALRTVNPYATDYRGAIHKEEIIA